MNRIVSHADALQIIGNLNDFVLKFQTLVPEIVDKENVQNVVAQDTSVFIGRELLAELSRLILECLEKQ